MNYHKLLKILRKELNIKQVDLYTDIVSKSSYRKIEEGTKFAAIEEIQGFTDRLGIRLSEFLFRADVTRRASCFFGNKKVMLPSLANDLYKLEEEFKEAYQNRHSNLQYYSLFLGCIAVGNSVGKNLHTFDSTDIKELKKMYEKRTFFLGIDYEILANLFLITDPDNFSFLFKKLFPVTQSNGETFDYIVQVAIKNGITNYLHKKDFDNAQFFLKQYENLRKLPTFILHGNTNLEVVYLNHLFNFLKNRDIEEYLNAVKIVNLFLELGHTEQHKLLVQEVTEIAKQENFEVPSSINAFIEEYVPISSSVAKDIE
ncbi:XRE family transcriptional regulator [Enterococcus faecalis]|nr:XRE family transcriptional regulator [Enterococcus faecalis]EGO8939140.1 XRE family transcriptional regulator [Enterococcus faecalis]EHP0998104.1 helix-turn-helix transcriptional regulator [Enterococcus faecalis]